MVSTASCPIMYSANARSLLAITCLLTLFGCGGGGGGTERVSDPSSTAPNWQYMALGDSLTSGDGASSPQNGYVNRYRDFAQTDTGANISLVNLGASGWTSAELRSTLTNSSDPSFSMFRDRIKASQLVTFNIGSNDLGHQRLNYRKQQCGGTDNQLCLRTAIDDFKNNWDVILGEILTLRAGSNTIIRTMDNFNAFVDVDKATDSWSDDGGLNDFQVLKPYFDELNAYISETSAAKGIPCAKVYLKFNGANGDADLTMLGFVSTDGQHPNDAGHAAIAELLRQTGYAPLK